jgi:bis(5'-nucleosyl)-tetraphosphatase (symmetrical)
MATYIVGDIQGCFDPLRRLLDQIRFDPAKDRLWATGDLVNRGPKSLETLRFFHSLGNRALTVLGNHDLHLLAMAHGHAQPKRSDTLDAVLNAPDRDTLLAWLQLQPLLHYDPTLNIVLTHAGIAPQWSILTALACADEVQKVLRSKQAGTYFAQMYGNEPRAWSDELKGPERWRVITNYLTRMRFVDADGALDLGNKKGPESARPGTLPWFEHPAFKAHAVTSTVNNGHASTEPPRIVFGHWASLEGKTRAKRFIGLDTGCIWGGKLTAWRADDGVLLEYACHECQ